MSQNTKVLLGGLVAAALAFAAYYGLISQQTASGIQNQANQTLGTTPAAQKMASPVQPAPTVPEAPQASAVPAQPNQAPSTPH